MVQQTLEGLVEFAQLPLAEVERELQQTFMGAQPLAREIAIHLLESGGKRIRPLIMLLSARLFTSELAPIVPVAAAAELIHMATLVHDDVIDESLTRRGRPTANHLWGNQAAVLTGDMLLALALTLLVDHSEARVVRLMAQMIQQMCEGEIQQNRSLFDAAQSERDYVERIRKKTADFFAACCEAGALVAGADADAAAAVCTFGRHMGISFQVIDDLLDVEGDAKAVGKPVGHDLRAGILTLPVLRALTQHPCAAQARAWLGQGRLTEDQVAAILTMVHETDAIAYARAFAYEQARRARQALLRVPDSPTRALMLSLAEFLLRRSR